MAHELHDEIGQILTTVNLNLEALRSHIDLVALPQLDESVQVVNHAIDQVRDLSINLRPASLDYLGLEEAVRAFGQQAGARAGLTVSFDSSLGGRRLPGTLETVCFRVVQQAITNVLRHARAVHCWIKLELSEAGIQIEVRDDGVGFNSVVAWEQGLDGKGFGLIGMHEQVQLFGGQLEIRSAQGGGTTLSMTFPVTDRQTMDDEQEVQ